MSSGPVSVVVPTFREAENIAELTHRVHAALSRLGIDWELILADDDSRDGSDTVVAELSRSLPVRITTRRGKPRDLSLAVLDGIRLARFDQICVMDADLSHPPERIADLLSQLDSDCDLVVGSRYAPGGRIDSGWSAYRHLNSRIATWLTRPLTNCADPLSGFFAVERLQLPDLASLRPIGYKIALELMVRGRLRAVEVPIAFRDRERGSSKLNQRQQFNFLRHLCRLYAFRFAGFVRLACFGLVGASGFLVDAGAYLGLQQVGVSHLTARFVSFWPAVTWNWQLNRAITFRDRPAAPRTSQWTRFAAASLIGLVVNVGSYWILTAHVPFFSRERFLALALGVVFGSLVNFLASSRYAFPARSPDRPG